VLTWWQGNISVHGFGLGTDVVLDGSYAKVAQVKAGNGLMADLHDFQLTGRGTALITAYDPILCNLSAAGGAAYGAVTDGVLQEIDVRTGLVRMQWTSLDHVALGESYESAARSSLAFPYDYFHLNSIDLDPDGSVLLSARNTWAAYDVDPRSGRILWRLGGRRSSFREGSGTRTAWQHDPRALGDGTFSIFDNGSAPTVHGQSRGIVLRLDPGSRTATLVSQLRHAPPVIAESQGNLQALPGGGWFVGWGQIPDFSEFGAEGQLMFDAHFPAHDQSYRSFRFDWTGTPAHRPSLAVAGSAGGNTLYASWNGATLVSAWRALAGPTPTALAPAAEVPRSGFETAIALAPGAAGPYFAVEALDASGRTLSVSAAVR
jgi:Arylsulfotransferase (ASST)